VLAAQGLVAVLVLAFVARAIAANWANFRAVDIAISPRPAWLALSTLMVVAVSVLQIQSWRQLLAGWGQTLRFATAARIWFLANLGRYVPGKVWSVAGMVVLAREAGVEPWAATASAFAVQALGLGTAVALVGAATPTAASPVRLGIAALAAAGTITLLASERAVAWLGRMAGAATPWRPLPIGAILASALLTFLGWVGYGLAFWLLARGLGLPATLSLPVAAGVFAVGYILGLLALFAPGGIGVREGVFIALLTPALGAGGALVLSLASRLQLTAIEAALGAGALLIGHRAKEDSGEPTRR